MYRLGQNGVNIDFVNDALEDVEADAYFVPRYADKPDLDAIGQAILRTGAEGLETYSSFLALPENGPLKGCAYLTPSGGGKSRLLVHGVVLGFDLPTTLSAVQTSVDMALVLAATPDIGFQTLVIPGVLEGTRVPSSLMAQSVLRSLHAFASRRLPHEISVTLACPTESVREAYSNVLATRAYLPAHKPPPKPRTNTRHLH